MAVVKRETRKHHLAISGVLKIALTDAAPRLSALWLLIPLKPLFLWRVHAF